MHFYYQYQEHWRCCRLESQWRFRVFQMYGYFAKHNCHCCFFRYPLWYLWNDKTVDSKSGAKEKKSVKFRKERKEIKYINKLEKKTQQNSLCCICKLYSNIYLQTVEIYVRKILFIILHMRNIYWLAIFQKIYLDWVIWNVPTKAFVFAM